MARVEFTIKDKRFAVDITEFREPFCAEGACPLFKYLAQSAFCIAKNTKVESGDDCTATPDQFRRGMNRLAQQYLD